MFALYLGGQDVHHRVGVPVERNGYVGFEEFAVDCAEDAHLRCSFGLCGRLFYLSCVWIVVRSLTLRETQPTRCGSDVCIHACIHESM